MLSDTPEMITQKYLSYFIRSSATVAHEVISSDIGHRSSSTRPRLFFIHSNLPIAKSLATRKKWVKRPCSSPI